MIGEKHTAEEVAEGLELAASEATAKQMHKAARALSAAAALVRINLVGDWQAEPYVPGDYEIEGRDGVYVVFCNEFGEWEAVRPMQRGGKWVAAIAPLKGRRVRPAWVAK